MALHLYELFIFKGRIQLFCMDQWSHIEIIGTSC